MSEPIAIRIGHLDTDRVTLVVRGREHVHATDYWDGNWLLVDIDLRVGGFTGRVAASLRTDELRGFREGLAAIYRAFHGEVTLESMEDWLAITLRCEKTGRVTVEGQAMDRPGAGNRLQFWLPDMDQTYLPSLIDQLVVCEKAFPVIGT